MGLSSPGSDSHEELRQNGMQNVSQSPYPRRSSSKIQEQHGSLLRGARRALSSRYRPIWLL